MRILGILFVCLVSLFATGGFAMANVVARIDLSEQRMHVIVDGKQKYSWKVSTGRGRYRTPRGNYRPQVMKRMHYSSKYNNAPMPHSIFFHRGYAIHGTTEVSRLGRPASHGCVRLHPSNARTLYNLVRNHGPASTRIQIVN